MLQTQAESEAAIREAVERLATRFHPLKVMFYGSRAPGELETAQSVRQAVLRQLP